jgi:wyosine [tRNA(Phe)-imidazoG37] synthetase (radical SAM superfamily)
VLTNGTMIHLTEVADALSLINQPILKLDSAIQTEFEAINQSLFKIDVFDLIDRYINLSIPNKIIQTILLRGERNGFKINNTKKESLDALASAINKINPKIWMLYAIDRETPEKKLEKITIIELEQIKNYLQNIVHCEIKIYG